MCIERIGPMQVAEEDIEVWKDVAYFFETSEYYSQFKRFARKKLSDEIVERMRSMGVNPRTDGGKNFKYKVGCVKTSTFRTSCGIMVYGENYREFCCERIKVVSGDAKDCYGSTLKAIIPKGTRYFEVWQD